MLTPSFLFYYLLKLRFPYRISQTNIKWQSDTHISKNILMKKSSFCKHFIIPQMKHSNPLQTTSEVFKNQKHGNFKPVSIQIG